MQNISPPIVTEKETLEKSGLKRFAFQPAELAVFQSEFTLVSAPVDLSRATPQSSIPLSSGCYFWTMRFDSMLYKIYIGQTRSLRKRVRDYCNEFQIHAPNDYKLRFFQEFIAVALQSSTLELYFREVSEGNRTAEETRLFRFYRPLINVQGKPTGAERNIIREAFREYYESVTRRALAGIKG